MLLWISPSGAQFQMPREDPVPNLTAFEDLDFSFRLPGDQTTWTCKADIERIFAYDPHEHPVYGMTLKLKGFSDEQLMQMYQMIRAKLGMPALPE